MHNFGRFCARLSLTLALWSVCAASVSAQTPASLRYEALLAQEQRVTQSPAATVEDFRVVINRYWNFVQRYRSSGFADNALWQAATIAADAFQRFGHEREKHRAVQLLQWLKDQYPHSPLQTKAAPQIAQLEAIAGSRAPAPTPAVADTTTVRAVHREVLDEVVRITVELDREVAFSQEWLDGPARVFFDLKGTRTVPPLVDASFRYDSDIVRHIRLGRHPNSTTRIVLDLENVSRYSVFTLYNPYRIVIDAERASGAAPRTRGVGTLVARGYSPNAAVGVARLASIAPLRPADVVLPNTRITPPVARNTPTTPIARNARLVPIAPATAKSRTLPVRAVVPVAVITRAAVFLPPAPARRNARAVPTTPAPPIAPPPPGSDARKPAEPAASNAPATVIAGKPIPPSANSSGKFSVARQLGLGVSRIVIDAGHGGHDPGASAFGISEAELVLDVTLRLEQLLQQQPGFDVVLTRRTNEYVTLEERTEIANRESADLFLSVHANASGNAAARGVETYFLNFALNPQAEAVAARENAASGKTMSSLPGIIKAITLNSKLNESRDFATSIQRSLVRGMRGGNKTLKDLGVKQAPFMVLIGASMPSVLAEISFVTNEQEARLLKLPAYRQRIAESLLAGILRYQQSLKKVQSAALQ